MEDYKAMYFKLFNETQKAIELLQKAHQDCEELFLSAESEEVGEE